MKMKEVLRIMFLVALTALSVIPSPIMGYVFNLFILVTVILSIVAAVILLGILLGGEEAVDKAVAEAKADPTQEKKYAHVKKALNFVYLPILIIMAVTGHWVVTVCWIFIYLILLGHTEMVIKKLKE